MNFKRSLWLALPLALLLPVGCNNAAESGQAPESAGAAPAAEAQAEGATTREHHHRHHARGPAQMLFRAAGKLDLSAAQQTEVDQLKAQLHAGHGGASDEHQAVRAALVAGVRAGSVDLKVIEPLQATAGARRQAHAEREATALNGLWATLQPAQRTALVATVRERQAEHAEHRAEHRGEHGAWGEHRLAHLTTELGLDAAQQQAVSGMMAQGATDKTARKARFAEMKSRDEAVLTAFAGDSFDANKLDLAAPVGSEMGPEHHARFLAQLVPILSADQRETLASSMEKHRG